MKVAIVHPDLGIGGAERLVVDVAVALKEANNEVLFVTNHFDKSHSFDELKTDLFLVRVIGDWIPRSFLGKFQAVFAYLRMCFLTIVYILLHEKKDRPDVYFVDQIPMANFFLKLCGKKIIYYCHHPDLLATPHNSLLKKIYRFPIDFVEEKGTQVADTILVNSQYTASVFRQTFPSIKKNLHILYPTISSSYEDMINNHTFQPISKLVPEIASNKSNVVFLSINRFHPMKKLELGIDAMENLQKIIPFSEWQLVYLIMAGGYDPLNATNQIYFQSLVKLIESKNLAKKVIFIKSPSDAAKADLLLSCDCLIYTPINEHFGIVPLEAMAARKPVIACNSGGPCETIAHDVNGYLSEPNGLEIAKYMKMLMNKEKSMQMGQKGRKRLQNKFNYSNFLKETANAFNSTLYKEQFKTKNSCERSGSFISDINQTHQMNTESNL